MSKNINVGIIGCELSEELFQINSMNKQEKFLYRKVFADKQSGNVSAAYPGMEVVQDVKAIIYDNDIELVIISNNHLGLVREAVAAGKAVRVSN